MGAAAQGAPCQTFILQGAVYTKGQDTLCPVKTTYKNPLKRKGVRMGQQIGHPLLRPELLM